MANKFTLRDAEVAMATMAQAMTAIREESQSGLSSLQKTLLDAIAGRNNATPATSTGENGKANGKPAKQQSKADILRQQLAALEAAVAADDADTAAATVAAMEIVTDDNQSPESILAVHDDADRASPILPSSVTNDRGAARDIVAGSFRLRKSSRSGSGSILWPDKPGKKGIASTPLRDDTTKKVTVVVNERQKDGSMKQVSVEKTQNLHDVTRNVAGPLAVDQYRTVIDHDDSDAPCAGNKKTGRRSIKFAQIDDAGHVIPRTEAVFRLSTSESGSLMLSGELSAKMHLKDDTGSAVVIFSPVARGVIYLMGKEYMQVQETKPAA